MNNIENLKTIFRGIFKNFQNFQNPGEQYLKEERNYKTALCKWIRDLFSEWVEGDPESISDDDFTKKLHTLLKTKIPGEGKFQNFISWRDSAFLFGKILEDKSDVRAFMGYLHALLKSSDGDGDISDNLSNLLAWLKEKGTPPNLSKIFPTFFLFLWNPKRFIFIKPRIGDRFFKTIGEKPLGTGKYLTVLEHDRLISVAHALRHQLNDLLPEDMIDVQSFIYRVQITINAGIKKYVIDTRGTVIDESDIKERPGVRRLSIPLNLILYGPPGTGKTYQLREKYFSYFQSSHAFISTKRFIGELVADLTWWEVLALSLYDRGPSKVAEIFSNRWFQAKLRFQDMAYPKHTIWGVLQAHTKEDCPHVNVSQTSYPQVFEKDERSIWSVDISILEEEATDLIQKKKMVDEHDPSSEQNWHQEDRFAFITFHQSFSYEEFVEGIRPIVPEEASQESIHYDVVPGIFKQLVKKAIEDPCDVYALFIDEINRANISKVFGELITLLEPDKRMVWNNQTESWEGGIRVRLPYSHTQNPASRLFGVPDNLYVIGTMNTADRSIALMDVALRRRFQFEEIMPDSELLHGKVIEDDDNDMTIVLADLLEAMNRRIEFLYDRDHQIGHSFFLKVTSYDDLQKVFLNEIIPLLQEYFYDDWEKVMMVLNDLSDTLDSDGRPGIREDAIITYEMGEPSEVLGVAAEDLAPRRLYRLPDQIDPESIKKIYESL